jgi:hypothetical protein
MRQLVHTEPAAGAAGTLRIVEDEIAWADLAVDEVMRGTTHRSVELIRIGLAHTGDDVNLHEAVPDEERRGDAGLDRLLVLPVDHEPIHDRVHVSHRRFVEFELRGDVHGRPVNDDAAATLLPQFGEDQIEILAVDLEHGRPQLDLGARRQREDGFEDLARRSARRRVARARAVWLPDGGEQQVQIARDVGHRADSGARVAGQRLLLDGNHRRQAEDEIDVGLGDVRDEPLGVGRERLHVATLPFGVDRVEGQARLARSGQTGDDDQPVARDVERDVFEVMDARALDGDRRPRRLRHRVIVEACLQTRLHGRRRALERPHCSVW